MNERSFISAPRQNQSQSVQPDTRRKSVHPKFWIRTIVHKLYVDIKINVPPMTDLCRHVFIYMTHYDPKRVDHAHIMHTCYASADNTGFRLSTFNGQQCLGTVFYFFSLFVFYLKRWQLITINLIYKLWFCDYFWRTLLLQVGQTIN